MISGIFHQGSGLGNQLHRYVMTRVLAEDKGYGWGMCNYSLFKGIGFMKIDTGIPIGSPEAMKYKGGNIRHNFKEWNEKKVLENGVDIRGYDPEINFVQDNTIIDGEFQDPRYFEHRLDDIREWLKVKPIDMPDDLCVIGFRGGEYTAVPALFLPQQYWDTAIALKRAYNPNMRFQVHTDDPITARKFFPDFEIIQNIEINWRSARYAKELIIANSSFYIFPSLLNENCREVIAPRYWARYNTKTWALPQNYYHQFKYIHHESASNKL